MDLPLLYHRVEEQIPFHDQDQTAILTDLHLDKVLQTMAGQDPVLLNICQEILIHPLTNRENIHLRQAVLQDAIQNPSAFSSIYTQAGQALEQATEKRMGRDPIHDRGLSATKRLILESETGLILLAATEKIMRQLAMMAEPLHARQLSAFRAKKLAQYAKPFLATAQTHLKEMAALKDTGGITLFCRIGQGLKPCSVRLCRIWDGSDVRHQPVTRSSWRRLFKTKKSDDARPVIIQLDTSTKGHNALEAMESALVYALRRVNQFNRSMLQILTAMRDQFGFYAGCLNLYNRLKALQVPVCFPKVEQKPDTFVFLQLSDVYLALAQQNRPVANDLDLEDIRLCLITGSNQGGKTTFLRSVGIAQIMAQNGLFVAAASCQTGICPTIQTHFPGSEDAQMKKGLLEQELSALADRISRLQPGSLLLLNETFASTSVREGSHLAQEITSALCDAGVTSLFVTHLYPFARQLYAERDKHPAVVFLRAERMDDGARTYRIRPGEPLATSYGCDLYNSIS